MKIDDALSLTADVLWMDESMGRELYAFIMKARPKRILELGFAYGKSTVIMAAALDELGEGMIDTVDLEVTREIFKDPSIEDLLKEAKLSNLVNVYREEHSYTWWLKKKLDLQIKGSKIVPDYDFCYLDGSHNFTVDSCAFSIVDRLLRPGATLLLDDLKYSYGQMNARQGKSNEPPPLTIDEFDGRCRVARTRMSEDELQAFHVAAIYNLLIKTNPDYHRFRISQKSNWGWARKKGGERDARFGSGPLAWMGAMKSMMRRNS